MSNSSLVTYRLISPYKYVRQQKIEKIILHHMAGNLSVKQCGNVFQYAEASAHYGVNGKEIGQYVPEDYSAWSAASYYYDQRSVAIELANDGGASTNWHVSDQTLATAIKLIVDICKRNGIKKLNYTGDLSGNLIMHCWTASTACPGGYMKTKFQYVADQVNKQLVAKKQLATPKLKSATANDDGSIALKWDKVTGAYRYRVFKKHGSGTWERVAVTTSTTYTDRAVYGGVKYTYTVRCIDDDGDYISSFDAKGVSATAKKVKETPYRVQITSVPLNIRKGAGTNTAIVGTITSKGIYTITEKKAGTGSKTGWGKLKSDAGWIALDFTQKL